MEINSPAFKVRLLFVAMLLSTNKFPLKTDRLISPDELIPSTPPLELIYMPLPYWLPRSIP